MLALFAAGLFSYFRLGQAEDPEFTFKVMVIRAFWPGATPAEMEQQVTERLEKKLQETPYLDNVRSFTRIRRGNDLRDAPGFDAAEGSRRACGTRSGRRSATSATRCRKARSGPFFNDEFGDVFGNIYAFTGDGYQLRRAEGPCRGRAQGNPARTRPWPRPRSSATRIRRSTSRPPIASSLRSASTRMSIFNVLREQNAMTPAGSIDTRSDRIVPAHFRQLRFGREHPRDRHPGQWPSVPARRHRPRLPQLRRSAVAEGALHGAGRDRAGRVDDQGRRHPATGPGPRHAPSRGSSGTCRSASKCISIRTSPRSSSARSTSSSGRSSKPS